MEGSRTARGGEAEYAGREERSKVQLARTGSALGTIGIAISHGDGERSMPLGGNAHWVPRVPTSAITAAGGTLPRLIEGLIDALRIGTMDVKERAAAALHSLSEQAKENAQLIGRDGLRELINLAEGGSFTAQTHAAATVGVIVHLSAE